MSLSQQDRLQRILSKNRRIMVELRQELSLVTKLLCQVVGEIESDGYTFNEELTEWWTKKKMDMRKEKESK